MPIKKAKVSASRLASSLLAAREQKALDTRDIEDTRRKVYDGTLVDEMVADLKKNGVNDQKQPLIFYRLFEEGFYLVGDLRIGVVYSTGIAQASKSALNSAVSCWLGQRANLTVAWAWPLADSVDKFQPMQHRPILDHLALKVSKAKVTKSSNTSNRLYDVGLGRNIYHSVSKGSAVQNADNAEVGAASASYTASVVFAEEASQTQQSNISPLISRVEKSISPMQPLRYLGTRGSGAGIEMSIAQNAEFVFVPHCVCNNCNQEVRLETLGTILKSQKVINDITKELEDKFLSPTGNILDWAKDEQGDPIIGCSHCGKELDDVIRQDAYFKCIKTGLTVWEFRKQILEKEWDRRRIQVAIDFTAPARQKPGRLVARSIIDEGINPSNLRDFLQQRVGISSEALGGAISQDHIDGAFARYPLVLDKAVRLIGIDQGRKALYTSIIEFRHPENTSDVQYIWNNLRGNVLFCGGITLDELSPLMDTYKVDGGAMDAKPSIIFAHQTRELTGIQMGEQFATNSINDDLRKGIIKDCGLEFDVWKFRTSKPARAMFDAYISGRMSVHPSLQKSNNLQPDSMARHLRAVSWNEDIADIKKANDGLDHLAFSQIFAFLAYNLYLVDPSEVLINSWNWWS
jgi:hypothetical protein